MRGPARSLSFLVLGLLGACGADPVDLPARAKVAPISPILDWASVERRGASPELPAEPAPAVASPAKKVAPVIRADSGTSAVARHSLFKRLPKDALLVIDAPDVAALSEAFSSSELAHLSDQPNVEPQFEAARVELLRVFEQAKQELPELVPMLELFPRLKGRLALSISGLTAETLAAPGAALPWVATIIYDAGQGAESVAAAAAPLLSDLAKRCKCTLVEKAEPAWGCEISDPGFMLDFERAGSVFELRVGGRAAMICELASARKRVDATSFFSARVATEAAAVETLGAREVLEVHLQLTSLWEALRQNGNRADNRVLARTGLSQFYGASMAVGRTERGLAEALTLHSPAGIDIVTHLLTGQPLDATLARCVPAGLANAGLYSFDGTRVIADLCLMLPPEAQSMLVRGLSEFRRELGIDFEKDLLCNFGPTIALATSGFSLADQTGDLPQMFLAVQVVDSARAQRSLGALLVASGHSDEVKYRTIDGVRVSSLKVPIEGVSKEFELHWCICSSVLLLSTNQDDLAEAMRGLRGREVLHAGLRDALLKAGAGCFAVGFTQGDAGTPDAVSIGRRTNSGLELTSADGAAMQSTIFVLGAVGAVSSLAIPRLLELRHDANEKAAASRLVVINDAEMMARMEKYLDLDRDGRGESLLLPELCGALPLRGSKAPLSEPWLSNDFRWVDGQVGEKNGYRYRVALAGQEPGAEPAQDARSIEAAEESSVTYAWPIDEMHGSVVFVFDSEGGLYSSDNLGEEQHYFGDVGPGLGAHWSQRPGKDRPGTETRTIGRDGGVWLRLRSVEDRQPGAVRPISRR